MSIVIRLSDITQDTKNDPGAMGRQRTVFAMSERGKRETIMLSTYMGDYLDKAFNGTSNPTFRRCERKLTGSGTTRRMRTLCLNGR